MKTDSSKVKTIAFIGMLGALSAVLMSVSVPLPFAPTFLKFDIAELPALFAGFFLGPVSGCSVIVVKIALKLFLQRVYITTTQTNRDFSEKTEFEVPYETVVSGKDAYIYLVTNHQEVDTLRQLNQWGNTLPSIGLKMKTGLTVDFRNREALRDTEEDDAVPLFFPSIFKTEMLFSLLEKSINIL